MPPTSNNHPQFSSNHPSSHGAVSHVAQLELDSVKLRAAELFPVGATMPAVKPRVPAVAQARTNELASVAFDASKGMKLIRAWCMRTAAA